MSRFPQNCARCGCGELSGGTVKAEMNIPSISCHFIIRPRVFPKINKYSYDFYYTTTQAVSLSWNRTRSPFNQNNRIPSRPDHRGKNRRSSSTQSGGNILVASRIKSLGYRSEEFTLTNQVQGNHIVQRTTLASDAPRTGLDNPEVGESPQRGA